MVSMDKAPIEVLPVGMSLHEIHFSSHIAVGFAYAAHVGQKYSLHGGDMPYINHCLEVALPFISKPQYIPAILHDVVEDNERITIADLRWIFGEWTAEVDNALSRREGERYLQDYIPRLSENSDAVAIKVSDLSINIKYGLKDPVKYATRIKRYYAALDYLSKKV